VRISRLFVAMHNNALEFSEPSSDPKGKRGKPTKEPRDQKRLSLTADSGPEDREGSVWTRCMRRSLNDGKEKDTREYEKES